MNETRLRKRINGLGGTMLATTGDYVALAPPGMCWSWEPRLHDLVSSNWGGEHSDAQVRRDLWDRVAMGVEKCDCSECLNSRADDKTTTQRIEALGFTHKSTVDAAGKHQVIAPDGEIVFYGDVYAVNIWLRNQEQ